MTNIILLKALQNRVFAKFLCYREIEILTSVG